jgi:MtN3 and saliva related transmembrane protein
MLETLSGYFALITSFIGLIPQIIKTIKTKSASDLSMLMLANYLFCSISWIVYGYLTDSMFVLWSNIVGGITSLGLIFCKYKYDNNIK